jgi:large subunit ribosomal protein L21
MYRVAENDRLLVERLPGDPGTTVTLNEVLMIAGDGDAPKLGGDLGQAAVFAEILAQKRGKKILVFKKKRRKNYRRTRGHRQELTELRIAGISLSGEQPLAAEAPVETPVEAEPAPAADGAEPVVAEDAATSEDAAKE